MPKKKTTKQKPKYFADKTAVIDKDVKIGQGTKIWHFSHIIKGTQIGENCRIGQNVVIGPNVKIGNSCKIQNNISIYGGVELEDYVFCGPSIVFTNILDPRCKYPQATPDKYKKTLVKEGASIGANATIVCGITIGKNAFIGAGSVVTKDVKDYRLVYGVPAREMGWVCECGQKLDLSKETAKCTNKCKKSYSLNNNILSEL
ncbi:DapH/DapD/GlmU-related protein [Candidatus Margulisiibacteriota bacterium]